MHKPWLMCWEEPVGGMPGKRHPKAALASLVQRLRSCQLEKQCGAATPPTQ